MIFKILCLDCQQLFSPDEYDNCPKCPSRPATYTLDKQMLKHISCNSPIIGYYPDMSYDKTIYNRHYPSDYQFYN